MNNDMPACKEFATSHVQKVQILDMTLCNKLMFLGGIFPGEELLKLIYVVGRSL